MEEGRVEGKHEANTETAQRLLAMGLSAEQIAKATQLPLEIIKNLSNSKNASLARTQLIVSGVWQTPRLRCRLLR